MAPRAWCGTLIWGLEFLPAIGGMKVADGDVMHPGDSFLHKQSEGPSLSILSFVARQGRVSLCLCRGADSSMVLHAASHV